MTDEEFLRGINILKRFITPELMNEFYKKAQELVKRPPTREHQRRYEKQLGYQSAYNKRRKVNKKDGTHEFFPHKVSAKEF